MIKRLQFFALVFSSIVLGACQIPGEPPAPPPKKAAAGELTTREWFTRFDPLACSWQTAEIQPSAKPWPVEPWNLWQRVRAGYAMDWQLENPRIDAEMAWFLRHPDYMWRVSQRSERYLYHIVSELDARGMPQELAMLPIVESAFDPFAYSHGRASGIWQFIPSTGRAFGLEQDWWYDGRRDIIASTDAALRYLDDLQRLFDGDWLLALAAYNAGQGTVSRAIRRNQARGKPTDFWSLELPRETRAYVPRLLALARLVHSPTRHGIELYPVANEPFFVAVDVGGQIDLAQAASLAGIDTDEIYRLNPAFNRWATRPSGPHRLLVPAASAEAFQQEIAALDPAQRLRWERYTVRNGDSLITIARRFDTDVAALREVNSLRGNLIRAGQTLMIPVASKGDEHYALSAEQRLAATRQRPRGGADAQRIQYTVRAGDSFWLIGRQHGVGVRELASWNGMAPGDTLRPGQELSIWVPGNGAGAAADRAVVRNVQYTVRPGDSLARIAQRFNVQVRDIVAWNSLDPARHLQPGQRLSLRVDVVNSR